MWRGKNNATVNDGIVPQEDMVKSKEVEVRLQEIKVGNVDQCVVTLMQVDPTTGEGQEVAMEISSAREGMIREMTKKLSNHRRSLNNCTNIPNRRSKNEDKI